MTKTDHGGLELIIYCHACLKPLAVVIRVIVAGVVAVELAAHTNGGQLARTLRCELIGDPPGGHRRRIAPRDVLQELRRDLSDRDGTDGLLAVVVRGHQVDTASCQRDAEGHRGASERRRRTDDLIVVGVSQTPQHGLTRAGDRVLDRRRVRRDVVRVVSPVVVHVVLGIAVALVVRASVVVGAVRVVPLTGEPSNQEADDQRQNHADTDTDINTDADARVVVVMDDGRVRACGRSPSCTRLARKVRLRVILAHCVAFR